MESWLPSGIILSVAVSAKNQSLMLAAAFVLIMKLIPISRSFFPRLQGKGINTGMTIITAAILIPIVIGEIGLRGLSRALRSPIGQVAVSCGGLVAVLFPEGVGLTASDPQITVALVFSTILDVVFLRGVVAGSAIAFDITYCVLQVFALEE